MISKKAFQSLMAILLPFPKSRKPSIATSCHPVGFYDDKVFHKTLNHRDHESKQTKATQGEAWHGRTPGNRQRRFANTNKKIKCGVSNVGSSLTFLLLFVSNRFSDSRTPLHRLLRVVSNQKVKITACSILLPLLSFSQKNYTVGDTIAPSLFTHLQQLDSRNANTPLSFGEGSGVRFYILTFFSPNCLNSCELATANTSLQQKFANRVSFINITRYPATYPLYPNPAEQGHEHSDKKINKANKGAGSIPPLQRRGVRGEVFNDTLFSNAFPYLRVPHIVIINNKGIVRAITSGTQLTQQNIQKLLNDPGATLPLKLDKPYNNNTSLLANLGLANPQPSGYTFITPYIEGLPAGNSRKWDSLNNCNRLTAVNANLSGLYALAFRKWLLRPWQIEIDSAVNKTQWCFEYCTPLRNDSLVSQQVSQFLDAYFKTTASIQTKPVQYLALADTTYNQQSTNHQPSTTNTTVYNALRSIPSLPYIENESFAKRSLPAVLLQQLEHANSIPAINRLINPYGLTIAPRQKTTGVLVIKSIINH